MIRRRRTGDRALRHSADSSLGGVIVRNVSRRFGERTILHNVTFTIRPGQVGALIGPNGSGKTTLLRIVAGVLSADRGTVSVFGGSSADGRASYVPPGDRGLYWRLTGLQNLEFVARVRGASRRRATELAHLAARWLDAGDLLGKRIGTCSTGQRRRLTVATGFIGLTPVVLIDEPFADLDEEGCRAVEAMIRRWASDGGTVLYATPARGGGPSPDIELRLRSGRVELGEWIDGDAAER